MSTFLINCSNLKTGGGLQVADSICGQLCRYTNHRFVVVLSKQLRSTAERISNYGNVTICEYDIRNNLRTILFGRDSFLDGLVIEYGVHAVLTVFGPSRWNPRCPHLSGFAMPHLVIPESPFFTGQPLLKRWRLKIRSKVLAYFFRRSTNLFWTENPYISDKLARLLGGCCEMGGVNVRTKTLSIALKGVVLEERRVAA